MGTKEELIQAVVELEEEIDSVIINGLSIDIAIPTKLIEKDNC